MPTDHSDHFILNGSDDLTHRLAEQLSSRYGARVIVVTTAKDGGAGRDFSDLADVAVVQVERVDEKALVELGLSRAAGLALTTQDDVGNIHVALQAREVAPAARIVVRMYNTALGHSIEALLGNCKVLSDSEIAAPELVATAMGEVAEMPIQVSQRVLVVAQRSDVAARDVVCALADTSASGEPIILPADADRANLVLAEHRGPARLLETTMGIGRAKPARTSVFRLLIAILTALVTRKTWIAVAVVLTVLIGSGGLLGHALELPTWETFYLATVTVLDGPEAMAGFTRYQQMLQLLLGLAGLALIPLITALVVEGAVRARLAVARARLNQPRSGHVVVVGLGGVGTRILRLLHDRGVKMVAISQDPQARGVALAHELDIPLLIGDPSRETTLRQAGVDRCKALMAVDRSDVANLQTALHGRNLHDRLRVVLRLFDADLADRIRRTFDLPLSRSVSNLAVPAFAEALMDREVIGTISVQRRVLLVAEIFVRPGSALDGKALAEAGQAGRSRIIAVAEFGEPRPTWTPSPTRQLRARDRLTVVASRDGLSQLIRLAGTGPDRLNVGE